MKVLVTTAIWPTEEDPAFGSFVRSQALALERAGIEVKLLILRGRFRKLIYPKGIFLLRKRLAAEEIDLVHAHYGYVGMVARTQFKVPLVVTYHGDDLLGTINEHGKTTPLSKVAAAAGRVLGKVADAVIVQSRQMAEQFKSDNVHIIPHEVDLGVFRPEERNRAMAMLELDPRKKYLLFAANPQIPVKRFPLAKQVAERLQRRDPAVELLVVYKEPQSKLALYMSACDALVFPSYQEGSPNIVKQAMACGLPVVATDVGDVREIIGSTPGCYVCSPTVDDFVVSLERVLDARPRTNGREQIRHLDGPNTARRVISVYEQTLKRTRWPRAAKNRAVV